MFDGIALKYKNDVYSGLVNNGIIFPFTEIRKSKDHFLCIF